MFNNYINVHDFYKVFQKLQKDRIGKNLLHFFKRGDKKVVATWNDKSYKEPTNWWDLPAVIERWNVMISGNKDVNYRDYTYSKYLHDKKGLRALVLGCGAGEKTVLWAKLGVFSKIDAYDMSDARIKCAADLAIANKVDHIINFVIKDVRNIKNGSYDVIIIENALHHFSPLADILDNIYSMLKCDGIFVMDEFVGADRFQWTQRQLDAINGCLLILPQKYKKLYKSDMMKKKMYATGRFFMKISDPSEAIESSKIMPCIHERFNVMEEKTYGGGILHPLFNSIAHNFLEDDEESREWLKIIFSVEDVLIKNGEVKGDFIFGVYRKIMN